MSIMTAGVVIADRWGAVAFSVEASDVSALPRGDDRRSMADGYLRSFAPNLSAGAAKQRRWPRDLSAEAAKQRRRNYGGVPVLVMRLNERRATRTAVTRPAEVR